ncbi:MAG: hypothetical protein ACOCXP_01600 [Candidatus Dojkabacteria bacterium]
MERRALLVIISFILLLLIVFAGVVYFFIYSVGLAQQNFSGVFLELIPGREPERDYNFPVPRVAGEVTIAEYRYELDPSIKDYNVYYPQEEQHELRRISQSWAEYMAENQPELELYFQSGKDPFLVKDEELSIRDNGFIIDFGERNEEYSLRDGQIIAIDDGAGVVYLQVDSSDTSPLKIVLDSGVYSLYPVL